jgi:predicted ester cyclase
VGPPPGAKEQRRFGVSRSNSCSYCTHRLGGARDVRHTPLVPHATIPRVQEDPAALVRRLHETLLADGDLGRLGEFFADDFTSHNMPPGLPQGIEGVRALFQYFLDGLTDISVTVDELIAEGDRVAVATTTSGLHTGELLGFQPTGRRVAVAGIDLVRVNGKIVEHRGLTDTAGLLRQLG